MATIETPPQAEHHSRPPVTVITAGGRSRAVRRSADGEFHLLISELQDENSRSRMREAVWISIILHMLVLFFLRQAPHLLFRRSVETISPMEMLKQREKELTYLDLPPDLQKPTPPTDRSIISDKDRIAMAKQPSKDELRKLRDNRRLGPPLQQQVPQQQNPQAAQQQAAPQQQNPQQNQTPPEVARLQPPPITKPPVATGAFKVGASAGELVQQAARATASAPGGTVGGDYGSGPATPNTNIKSDLDILSDTMGVDFSPYLQRVLHSVRQNWYTLIPEIARPPLLQQGKVTIEFVIGKNGTVTGMRLSGPSGDVSLDRAAWGGITASNPFPPLPGEYRGDHLALRFHFYYNPDRNEMR
jgi:TonB family protein